MNGKVVHVLSGVDYEVYVGRAMPRFELPASPWANAYKVRRDGDLSEVLRLYESHVRENIGVERVWMAFGYPSPVLACWCAPRDGTPLTREGPEVCHAQILLRIARETSTPA